LPVYEGVNTLGAVVRQLCLVLTAFALLTGACSESDTTPTPPSPSDNDATVVPVTPAEKPVAVPDAAEAVTESEVLGQITREAGGTPEGIRTREIEGLSCDDDVMTLATEQETIYAVIQCDGVPVGDQLDLFLGQEAAIELEAGATRFRVLIETIEGSQAEFTVAAIRVE
jgi:hypothetical protein